MSANDKQIGGKHYQTGKAEQHWDRIYKLYGRGYFVGCATKYIERYHEKNGKQDLEKAMHFIQKLIELEYPVAEREKQMAMQVFPDPTMDIAKYASILPASRTSQVGHP